jgi:hypothetical protein
MKHHLVTLQVFSRENKSFPKKFHKSGHIMAFKATTSPNYRTEKSDTITMFMISLLASRQVSIKWFIREEFSRRVIFKLIILRNEWL